MKIYILFAFALGLIVLPVAAQGTICSPETIRGNWGVTCGGSLTPGPGAPLTQTKILGTCVGSAGAFFECEATLSLAGTIMTQGMKGQALVNENCTLTIKYTQTINGQPAPDINIRALILDAGRKMKGLSVDPGTMLACKLERMGL